MVISFSTSPQFDLFFAIQTVLDPRARIHKEWRAKARNKLSARFWDSVSEFGGYSHLWAALPDILPALSLQAGFGDITGALEAIDGDELQRRLLGGLLHQDEIVMALLEKDRPLLETLAKIPHRTGEWLGFMDLYPLAPDSPGTIALELLISDPERFRFHVLSALEAFWHEVFRETWEGLKADLNTAMAAKERLFYSCRFGEFARQTILRVEVDEAESTLRAVRGGFKVKIEKIESCAFFPSAFNDKRYWSAVATTSGQYRVCFPFFEPALSLDNLVRHEHFADPELDPALILKVLGDSTRFAIATLLAGETVTSVGLANILSLSKPTISHHVGQLRQAGLIEERHGNGSVEMTLRRSTLEALSGLLIKRLYEKSSPLPLTLTRSKK